MQNMSEFKLTYAHDGSLSNTDSAKFLAFGSTTDASSRFSFKIQVEDDIVPSPGSNASFILTINEGSYI